MRNIFRKEGSQMTKKHVDLVDYWLPTAGSHTPFQPVTETKDIHVCTLTSPWLPGQSPFSSYQLGISLKSRPRLDGTWLSYPQTDTLDSRSIGRKAHPEKSTIAKLSSTEFTIFLEYPHCD
jgi:hypothetical protein